MSTTITSMATIIQIPFKSRPRVNAAKDMRGSTVKKLLVGLDAPMAVSVLILMYALVQMDILEPVARLVSICF